MNQILHLAKTDWRLMRANLAAWVVLLIFQRCLPLFFENGYGDNSAIPARAADTLGFFMVLTLAFSLSRLHAPRAVHDQHRLWPVSPWRWIAAKSLTVGLWLFLVPLLLDAVYCAIVGYGANTFPVLAEGSLRLMFLWLPVFAAGAASARTRNVWVLILLTGGLATAVFFLQRWIRMSQLPQGLPQGMQWAADPWEERFLWAAIPALAVCAVTFLAAHFEKYKRLSYFGVPLAAVLAVGFAWWPGHLPRLTNAFRPRVISPAPAAAIAESSGELWWRPLAPDEPFDWSARLEWGFDTEAPHWSRLVPESGVVRDSRNGLVKMFALNPAPSDFEQAGFRAMLAKLRPSNAATIDLPGKEQRGEAIYFDSAVGQITRADALNLAESLGTLEADVEIGGFGEPYEVEIPPTDGAVVRRNGFVWTVAMETQRELVSGTKGFQPFTALVIRESGPKPGLPIAPLNVSGIRRPAYRFPHILLRVPEGNLLFFLPFRGGYDQPFGRMHIGETTRAVQDSDLRKEIAAGAPEHPLLKLAPGDPSLWDHLRFSVLEMEIVSWGVKHVKTASLGSAKPGVPAVRDVLRRGN